MRRGKKGIWVWLVGCPHTFGNAVCTWSLCIAAWWIYIVIAWSWSRCFKLGYQVVYFLGKTQPSKFVTGRYKRNKICSNKTTKKMASCTSPVETNYELGVMRNYESQNSQALLAYLPLGFPVVYSVFWGMVVIKSPSNLGNTYFGFISKYRCIYFEQQTDTDHVFASHL